jgi:hypothetical protein
VVRSLGEEEWWCGEGGTELVPGGGMRVMGQSVANSRDQGGEAYKGSSICPCHITLKYRAVSSNGECFSNMMLFKICPSLPCLL